MKVRGIFWGWGGGGRWGGGGVGGGGGYAGMADISNIFWGMADKPYYKCWGPARLAPDPFFIFCFFLFLLFVFEGTQHLYSL